MRTRVVREMAEGEGFEPPVPFQVQRFSRPPVSTAHTSLRVSVINSLPPAMNEMKMTVGGFASKKAIL
jgi:hypothetical protein